MFMEPSFAGQYTPSTFLTWLKAENMPDALKEWTGEIIYKRGLDYWKKNKVIDISLTPDGRLLGSVAGSRKYSTVFFLDSAGKPGAICDCPYEFDCKHAVALAWAAHDMLTQNRQIPVCPDNDRRLLKLEFMKNEADQGCAAPQIAKLEDALNMLSREELIQLLIQSASLSPEVLNLCLIKAAPSDEERKQAMINDVRRSMLAAANEPDWDEYYHGCTEYDTVSRKMQALLPAGFLEEILELADEVLQESQETVASYDTRGELSAGVAHCMAVAAQALRDVTWPEQKKLLWAVNAIMEDDCGLCEPLEAFLGESHEPAAWNPAADLLLNRLSQYQFDSYARPRVVNLAAQALGAAARHDELLALYENEAIYSGEYIMLVDYLLDISEREKAEEWIARGLRELAAKKPYAIKQLRERLRRIKEERNDYDAALALLTEDFVDSPSVENFNNCRHCAKKFNAWDALRPLLMDFLTKRKIPWLQSAWPCRNRGLCSAVKDNGPAYGALIALAIAEKQPGEALKWYDEQLSRGVGPYYDENRLADAVKTFAPERALNIWRQEAEKLIARTDTKAYAEAAVFLRKAGRLLKERKESARWNDYIAELRVTHRRKRRLLEELDKLVAEVDGWHAET